MKDEDITRQEAIKKMGKYATFVALGTMIMLTPKQAQAHSVNGARPRKPRHRASRW